MFKKRIILHLDMDAFFASIETVQNPELKGKPVIIGGPFESRGVVSTCSYEARAYGVRSAMPLMTAKRLCPNGIFISGNYSLYRAASEEIFSVLHAFSRNVEETSIDEGYLDITEEQKSYDSPLLFGKHLKESVFLKTGLTSSVGIGPNKMIAKMGSSIYKPNGLFIVPDAEIDLFLEPLKVGAIPGIGKVTEEEMNRMGIKTIKDLKERSLQDLIRMFGSRGFTFYNEARGIDNRKIEERTSPKSIGAETTFDEDTDDLSLLEQELEQLVVKVHKRLKNKNLKTRGISLKIRFFNFTTFTRSSTFKSYVSDFETLEYETKKLFSSVYVGKPPLRLIGVTFDKLNDGWWQPTLF